MFNIDMDKIKEKANSFKEVASETFVKTVNAAERAATTAKVKFKITSKEIDIKNEYKEIGKIIYEAYKEDIEADNEKIAEKCVCIDKLNTEISELKVSVSDIKEEPVDSSPVVVSEIPEDTSDFDE